MDDADHSGDGHVERSIREHEWEWLHLEQDRDDFRALRFVLEQKRSAELKEQDVADGIGNDYCDSTANGGS